MLHRKTSSTDQCWCFRFDCSQFLDELACYLAYLHTSVEWPKPRRFELVADPRSSQRAGNRPSTSLIILGQPWPRLKTTTRRRPRSAMQQEESARAGPTGPSNGRRSATGVGLRVRYGEKTRLRQELKPVLEDATRARSSSSPHGEEEARHA